MPWCAIIIYANKIIIWKLWGNKSPSGAATCWIVLFNYFFYYKFKLFIRSFYQYFFNMLGDFYVLRA